MNNTIYTLLLKVILFKLVPDSRGAPEEGINFWGVLTHSSILAWRISWTEGPGGLRSLGLQRVGQD